jgi:hypothetical protein
MTVQFLGAVMMVCVPFLTVGASFVRGSKRSKTRTSQLATSANRRLIRAMAVAGAFSLGIDSAQAGFIQVQLPTTPAYTITYNNANLAPAPAIGYDKATNTLVETATLTSNDPFVIKFQENAAPEKSSHGAFKINVSLNLTNGTNQNWTGFTLSLMDVDTSTGLVPYEKFDPKEVEHPNEAHFHPAIGKNKKPDFDKVMSNPFNKPAVFYTQTSFTAEGGGQVGNNEAWTASGFFIHEIDIAGLARTFYLVETPILAAAAGAPEPSAIVMAGMGALFALAYGWSRRRRPCLIQPASSVRDR